MNPFFVSYKNLKAHPLTFFLNCLLICFGVGILTILLIASAQLKEKLSRNAKDIDLVVGAKGSPLQLILSSIYYIDFPTGNISLNEANALARNPMVKRAVPLGLGDNYNGFRIVGTDTGFVYLYGLSVSGGRFWNKDFEVTIGEHVASALKLKIGDYFFGSHGLTAGQDVHKDHPYKVAGILSPQGNVTDNLILTNMASIWKMHGNEEEHEAAADIKTEGADREITALLIQYESPMSIILFPRMVNKSTNMQAASPALESGRLFSVIGVGLDTVKWFAICVMFIAAISVFVSIYNSLKERKYDLAVMRIMGASRASLFVIVILEGLILTTAGSLSGIVLGHLVVELIGHYQSSSQAMLTGFYFLAAEIILFLSGILIGVIAAIIPAVGAYRAEIAKIISKN